MNVNISDLPPVFIVVQIFVYFIAFSGVYLFFGQGHIMGGVLLLIAFITPFLCITAYKFDYDEIPPSSKRLKDYTERYSHKLSIPQEQSQSNQISLEIKPRQARTFILSESPP